jgi:hypothetical protein
VLEAPKWTYPLLFHAPDMVTSSTRNTARLHGASSSRSPSRLLLLQGSVTGSGKIGLASLARSGLVNNVSPPAFFIILSSNADGWLASFDGEAPFIKYPVLAIAGIVAVAQALPLLVASIWRSTMSLVGRGSGRRFTTRDSFARGRGDYAVVDDDEGELLGDESDEEV